METEDERAQSLMEGGGARSPKCEAQLTYVDKAQSLKRDQLETTKSEGRGDGLSTKNFASLSTYKMTDFVF